MTHMLRKDIEHSLSRLDHLMPILRRAAVEDAEEDWKADQYGTAARNRTNALMPAARETTRAVEVVRSAVRRVHAEPHELKLADSYSRELLEIRASFIRSGAVLLPSDPPRAHGLITEILWRGND